MDDSNLASRFLEAIGQDVELVIRMVSNANLILSGKPPVHYPDSVFDFTPAPDPWTRANGTPRKYPKLPRDEWPHELLERKREEEAAVLQRRRDRRDERLEAEKWRKTIERAEAQAYRMAAVMAGEAFSPWHQKRRSEAGTYVTVNGRRVYTPEGQEKRRATERARYWRKKEAAKLLDSAASQMS